MRVLALAAAAKQIYKRRIAVLDERIEAVKASMAARRKQAIAMAAAVVAAGEAATEPRRNVRRALGKWRGSTVGIYLADSDEKTYKACLDPSTGVPLAHTTRRAAAISRLTYLQRFQSIIATTTYRMLAAYTANEQNAT